MGKAFDCKSFAHLSLYYIPEHVFGGPEAFPQSVRIHHQHLVLEVLFMPLTNTVPQAEQPQCLVRFSDLTDEPLQKLGGGVHRIATVIFAIRGHKRPLTPLVNCVADQMSAGRLLEFFQGIGEDKVYPLKAELLQYRLGAALFQYPAGFIEMLLNGLFYGACAADIFPKAVLMHLCFLLAPGLCPGVGVEVEKVSFYR